jgi:hypothetical protein
MMRWLFESVALNRFACVAIVDCELKEREANVEMDVCGTALPSRKVVQVVLDP